MTCRARRPTVRPWRRLARRVLMAMCLWGAAEGASAEIISADYAEPTERYPHGVLGDAIEYGALRLRTHAGREILIRLPESRVFEDTAPRLVDLDGDGAPEVVVAESDALLGARLSVYGESGLIAAGPFIGTRFRWLAIAGAADLDGDGHVEIAYVDRPHLAKTLRIFRFRDGGLREVASLAGLTNHRIGERDIAGGIRQCPGRPPEVIVADSTWREVRAVTFREGTLAARRLSDHGGRQSFRSAMACAN